MLPLDANGFAARLMRIDPGTGLNGGFETDVCFCVPHLKDADDAKEGPNGPSNCIRRWMWFYYKALIFSSMPFGQDSDSGDDLYFS